MKNILPACLFLSLSVNGFAQWNSNTAINTPICNAANDQKNISMVTDTKGGAYIAWGDLRNNPASSDIFIQRINSLGYNLWANNGLGASIDPASQSGVSIVEDGTGGVILAWDDLRNGNVDIYAQKIDSNGIIQWATNGVPVVVKANYQKNPKLISDGAGGAIVVWQDSVSGLADIYAQRINNTGSTLWATGGVIICNAAGPQASPKIQANTSGDGIIVWQDKRNGVDYDIYAQKVNLSGAPQWVANGVAICTSNYTQSNAKLRSDGLGGAIIAWQDKRNSIDYDIYAQEINSSGAVQWAANGVALCTAAGTQSSLDMTNEAISNGVIVTWKDDRSGNTNNYDVYAQKIITGGVVQWTANGVAISAANFNQINPNIIGDGAGGAIVAWQDSVAGTWDTYSQKINANGIIQWAINGIAIGNAADDQTGPKNVSDGTGGSIYAWEDLRNTIDRDIYAQHVYSNGAFVGIKTLDDITVSIICYPNPLSSTSTIDIKGLDSSSNQKLQLVFYDLLGKPVLFGVSRNQSGFIVSRENIDGGIYYYRIFDNQRVIGLGKITVIN